jgi:hypothetical protein
MNYYNLPKKIDLLVNRLLVKVTSESYLGLVAEIQALPKTTWNTTITQLKKIANILIEYQTEALDGDLQDLIDELTTINWYNFLQQTKKIEMAVELIEEL